MSNELFREKSLKKMQSPENLNEYIKVINPGLWIVFIAAFLLLAGAFVWGTVGKIEDKTPVTVICQGGKAICGYDEKVQQGMKVTINGKEGKVSSVTPSGITITFDENIPDGVYYGNIVLGTISPISFVFN